jgi:hypothetical protein
MVIVMSEGDDKISRGTRAMQGRVWGDYYLISTLAIEFSGGSSNIL